MVVALALTVHTLVGPAAAEQPGGAAVDRPGRLDPTAAGPHQVAAVEYALGDTAFNVDGFTAELTGAVHYPADADGGARPLVVLAHGLFATCADRRAGADWRAAREALYGREPVQDPAERDRQERILADADAKLSRWPCLPGIAPVPNHRGYDYLARHLASHGFVALSVRANGINAGSETGAPDGPARARLIDRHLVMWQQLATSGSGPLAGRFVDIATGEPRAVDFRGRVDLTNVGTMGHSRSGRAVMYHAAAENRHERPAGVRVRAVVPLEPVPHGGDDVVTDVPFATVIGACDRVSNPAARGYLDNARGKNTVRLHQLLVHGANHSFFNTQWSPSSGQVTAGDDAYDAADPPYPAPGHCRTTDASRTEERQLSEEQQRLIGLGYVSAFFRRYLTDETGFDAMLTGKDHPLADVGRVDVEAVDQAR